VSEALAQARAALAGERAWLVGGVLRDRLLGRETADLDVVVAGDAGEAARRVARATGGAPFALSDAFGAWRVVGPDQAWQVDLTPLRGERIEDDLAQRDFTVNAMAEPIDGGELVDPFGGAADLAARRLRMVGARAFEDDPLRVLRVARFACELGLAVEPETAAVAGAHAGGLADVAGERVFAELRRVICADAVRDGLALMDDLGATPVVLPELTALRGVEQSHFHHLDVLEHTLAVLDAVVELERDPGPALGEHAQAAMAVLAEPLADGLTRGEALRFGALLHDAAKPQTRAETPEGRITFMGHDAAGAELARAVLSRLRTSERLQAHVAALARHHLRLGFLVHERPLSRRHVFRYLRACEPVEVDVTVLSVADRLATRGHRSDDAIPAHLTLSRAMLGEALRWRAEGPRPPLVRGDELAAELGIRQGPQLGELLAALDEAGFAGEIATREQALALARVLADG
jgi:poly(A) polymerase